MFAIVHYVKSRAAGDTVPLLPYGRPVDHL